MDYCNLRVFTHYSIFNSIIKIPDLINYCKKNNIRAIGISEHENMFGFVEFSKLCKSAGIKPIFSCSLRVENLGSIIFFIKNLKGFQSLSYLLSQYKIHSTNNEKSYISYDMLEKLSGVLLDQKILSFNLIISL